MRGIPAAVAALLLGALAAVPPAMAVDLTVVVPNTPPVVGTLVLRDPGTLSTVTSRSPTAGDTTELVVDVPVTDVNLVGDITGVTVGITTTGGAEVWPQTAASVLSTQSAIQRTYRATVSMHYWDAAGTYRVKVAATDTAVTTTQLIAATFTYAEGIGLSAPAELDLSAVPGDVGSSAASALSIANWGNIQMDPEVSGAGDLDGPGSAVIPLGDVDYSLASAMTSPTALSTTPTQVTGFDLARQTSSTEVPKDLWFRIDTPAGLPAGSYAGVLTVSAVDGR